MKMIIHLNPAAVAATLGVNAEVLKAVRTAFDKPTVVRDYGSVQLIYNGSKFAVAARNPIDAMALIVHPLVERLEQLEISSRTKLVRDGNPIFQIDDPTLWQGTLIQCAEKFDKHWLGRYHVPKPRGEVKCFNYFSMWQNVGVVNNGSTNEATIAAITYDGHDVIYRVCSDRSHQLIKLSDYRLFKTDSA